MTHSQELKNLTAALVAARAKLSNPTLDEEAKIPTTKGSYSYKYASLAAVCNAILPVFAEFGLAVVQCPENGPKGPAVETLLTHISGEWILSSLEIPALKADAQAWGSAITYARRYSLQALAGVVGEDDDDAQSAMQRPAPQTQQRPAQAPARPAPAANGAPRQQAAPQQPQRQQQSPANGHAPAQPAPQTQQLEPNAPISQPQLAKIHATAGDIGLSQDEYHDFIEQHFGVRSAKALTMRQASRLIELLNAELDSVNQKEQRRDEVDVEIY